MALVRVHVRQIFRCLFLGVEPIRLEMDLILAKKEAIMNDFQFLASTTDRNRALYGNKQGKSK